MANSSATTERRAVASNPPQELRPKGRDAHQERESEAAACNPALALLRALLHAHAAAARDAHGIARGARSRNFASLKTIWASCTPRACRIFAIRDAACAAGLVVVA